MNRLWQIILLMRELNRDLLGLLGPRRYRLIVSGLLLLSGLLLFYPPLTLPFEFLFSDNLQNLERQISSPVDDLVILSVDAETLEAVPEKWPWSAPFYHKILTRVAEFHPRRILFCLPLPASDRDLREDERQFVATLHTFPNLELARLETRNNGELLPSDIQRVPHARFSALLPTTIIRMDRDRDGRFREFLQTNRPASQQGKPAPGPGLLCFAEKIGGFSLHPLKDIFDTNFPKDALASQTVLIGVSAAILHDYRNTVAGQRSGVEILTVALDNLQRERRVIRCYGLWPRTLMFSFGLLTGVFLILTLQRFSLLISLLASGITIPIAGIVALNIGYVLPFGLFWISWVLCSFFIASFTFFRNQVFVEVMRYEGLEVAKIQRAISPQTELVTPQGIRCQGHCLPCEDAGGDFFDFFQQENGSVFVFIGDVSGHGFPAGMVTTMAKAVISKLRRNVITSPGNVIFALNKVLFQILRRKRHMTGIACILFPEKQELFLSLAGHVPALIFSADGEMREISKGTFPLGMVDRVPLEKIQIHQTSFKPGDCLVLYTDGITEAQNWEDEFLQQYRWNDMLKNQKPLTAQTETFTALLQKIQDFTSGYPFPDDVSIVLLSWGPPLEKPAA